MVTPALALGRARRGRAAAMDRWRRRARGGMAAAPRAERDADDRQPQRRRRRARDHRASGARLPRRARLGRRAAHRDLGLPLPRRRGHRVQPQRRRALADLGRRPHLPARREGRPHAGARGPAGRAEVHRPEDPRRRGLVHRRAAGPRLQGRRHAHAGRLDHRDRRARRHRQGRGLAHQGVPHPHHRPLPPALRPLHHRGAAAVRLRRHA